MGTCTGIEEQGLQAAGWPSVIMDDKWSAIVTRFKISQRSAPHSGNSFTCQRLFLY